MVVHMVEAHDATLVILIHQQYHNLVQFTNVVHYVFGTIRLSVIPAGAYGRIIYG